MLKLFATIAVLATASIGHAGDQLTPGFGAGWEQENGNFWKTQAEAFLDFECASCGHRASYVWVAEYGKYYDEEGNSFEVLSSKDTDGDGTLDSATVELFWPKSASYEVVTINAIDPGK